MSAGISTSEPWDTGDQIRQHKLACSIINLHGTDAAVFDPSENDLLSRFTNNRSIATRDAVLAERGWSALDGSGNKNEKKVLQSGSLAGFLIARYGTDDPALDEKDWDLLGDWYGKGMPLGLSVSR